MPVTILKTENTGVNSMSTNKKGQANPFKRNKIVLNIYARVFWDLSNIKSRRIENKNDKESMNLVKKIKLFGKHVERF